MNAQFNLNSEMRQMQQKMQGYLIQHRKIFMAEGIIFMLLGTAAIIIPHVFTMGITLLLG